MSKYQHPVSAGRLNKLMTIQSVTVSRSSNYNEPTETWATATTAWCNLRPVSSTERFEDEQVRETVTHIITLRKYDNLTSNHRFVWNSRTFEVVGMIDIDERNHTQRVNVREVK